MRNTNLIAGLVLMSGLAGAAEADLMVHLCDKVGVVALELGAAKRLATSLMAKAGIKVQFADCGSGEPLNTREILMSIEHNVPERLQNVLGYALPYTERANRATLNYPKIEKTSPAQTERLLGTVMAHELAHLLFRSAAHGEGLMRETWTREDIRAMGENRLVFSAEQAAALRAGLQARVAGTLMASAR